MKTVTLQGDLSKFNNLEQATSDFDTDRLPYEVETRVYAVDSFDRDTDALDDDEFMAIAEEEGTVFTLPTFQQAFNDGDLKPQHIIRFITVPLHL